VLELWCILDIYPRWTINGYQRTECFSHHTKHTTHTYDVLCIIKYTSCYDWHAKTIEFRLSDIQIDDHQILVWDKTNPTLHICILMVISQLFHPFLWHTS
jgi:hypothetical protein